MGDRVRGSIPGAKSITLSQYITSHPGQLSLAIPLWVGVMSTSQRAVMPCGWGVKAGMVREWVAGKTVWSPCYHGPYLSALAMGSSHNRALYKCPITLLTITYLLMGGLTAPLRAYGLLWAGNSGTGKEHKGKWSMERGRRGGEGDKVSYWHFFFPASRIT